MSYYCSYGSVLACKKMMAYVVNILNDAEFFADTAVHQKRVLNE